MKQSQNKAMPLLQHLSSAGKTLLRLSALCAPLSHAATTQIPKYALVPVSSVDQFEQQLKQAVSQRPPVMIQYSTGGGMMANGSASVAAYSTTNTQETGVDEPDLIKYNGRYLLTLTPEIMPFFGVPMGCKNPEDCKPQKPKAAELKVYDTRNAPLNTKLSPLFTFTLKDNERAEGIFLVDEGFLVISKPQDSGQSRGIMPHSSENTRLRLFGWSNKSKPKLVKEWEIEGDLQSARRINGKAYFVVSAWPNVPGSSPGMPQPQFAKRVNGMSLDQLLPKLHTNGKPSPLFDPSQCLQQKNADKIEGINVVVSVDTKAKSLTSSCVLGDRPEVYASPKRLYLTLNHYPDQDQANNRLRIHQFSEGHQQAVDYQGTAEATGWLAGHRASFRMSEFNNHLRVVVDQANDKHQLFIFSTQAKHSQLPLTAKLPNNKRSDPIGKPGEQIYSVRYWGDQAYVVTFKRIDPLYKINLENPSDPFIEGALEIPGYSDYLQVLPKNLLLGSGYEVDSKARRTQVKIALFDTANKTPKVLKSAELNSTYTELTRDHHALACLTELPSIRCVMPSLSDKGKWSWQSFSVNTDQKTIHLNKSVDAAALGVNRPQWLRSVIQGDRLMLIADGNVQIRAWEE